MRIAVAGATGTVGKHVVAAAQRRGHDVVRLSRAYGVDVVTGAGLPDVLEAIDAVIDVTNLTTLSAGAARSFFEAATRGLLTAERDAGVAHHVCLSIVGIDGIDASYYAGKLAQERTVRAGTVPYTIARATQFHEFAGQLLAGMKGPVAVVPKLLCRPVAAREVGEHLVEVAEGPPLGRATDLVGPRKEILADMARRQLAHDRIRRKVLEVRFPGAYGRGLASGSLRGGDDLFEARITFDEWLNSTDHERTTR